MHPSNICCLSMSRSQGQHSKQRCPDFPLPTYLLEFFPGYTKAFPSQLKNLFSISWSCLLLVNHLYWLIFMWMSSSSALIL